MLRDSGRSLRQTVQVRLIAIAGAAVLSTSCMVTPRLGEPVQRPAGSDGYRLDVAKSHRRVDDTLIVLSFSGGGTRASALAYGVLEQLAADVVEHDGAQKRLLDEVDVISAVSGGSIVAAYYGVYGEAIFRDFRKDFLENDSERDLWISLVASPLNWVRLASRNYSRGDLFAEWLDRKLFHGASFADLKHREDQPFVVLNATDLSTSGRFEFTQDWFDAICVNLMRYPVARAVAASSAVPVVFSPITLRNAAGTCGYRMPRFLGQASKGEAVSRGAQMTARLSLYQDSNRTRYLHLVDGAVSDNLGIRAAIDVLAAVKDLDELEATLAMPGIQRIAVITVNAAGRAGEGIAVRRRPPNVVEMAMLSGGALIDQYSSENRILLRELLAKLSLESTGTSPIETYWIDVELNGLGETRRRERLRAIPTGLSLSPPLVSELICSARELLVNSVDYRRLLHDLGGTDPRTPQTAEHCRY